MKKVSTPSRDETANIAKKVLVMGVKGGTGKSMVAVNLALELARRGHKVGLVDIDIDSSNEGEILRVMDRTMTLDDDRNFVPVEVKGIKLFSMGLFHREADKAFTKTGEQNRQIVRDAIKHTAWGKLDYLILDAPAGSSDEIRAVIEAIETLDGAIITTQPTTVVDCQRALQVCSRFFIPVYGIIENMAYGMTECGERPICPKCRKEFDPFGKGDVVKRLAKRYGVLYLGQVPLISDMPARVSKGDPTLPPVAIDPIKLVADKMEAKE